MVPLQGDCISALDVAWKVEVTSTSSSSELIRCSQSNSEIHAYSDKAYANDEIYIRSPVVSSISRQCRVSIVKEEISDEKLRSHFQGGANGQETGRA